MNLYLENMGLKLLQYPSYKSQWQFKINKIAEKIIKEEDIKLVHAHARIPAFILSLLQILGFTMITTAHGIFHVNFLLRRITRWGDEVLL